MYADPDSREQVRLTASQHRRPAAEIIATPPAMTATLRVTA